MIMTIQHEHWHSTLTMLRGYRSAQVLITCAELDIFTHIGTKLVSVESLAEKIGTHAGALERLLNAAVSLDLLEKQDGTYTNLAIAHTCLIEGSPYYLGRILKREGAFYRRWSNLTEAVQTGKRPEENIKDEVQPNWVRDFELALYDIARVLGPAVAETLNLPDGESIQILDVGGGHGGYSIALAQRYPKLSATVFELPAAAEVAQEIIASTDMSERVSVQSGDFQKEGLGEGYDLILLFGVLVSETVEGKIELLKKCHSALKAGGTIVIREFWVSEDRTEPKSGPLFSLHMLLSNNTGNIATRNELFSWIESADFTDIDILEIPNWIDSRLIVAKKV